MSANNYEDGYCAIEDLGFLETISANTVLIDGNLGNSRHGVDGAKIFDVGYRRGAVHPVNTCEGIGAVAIGCSIDGRAGVAYVTGCKLLSRRRTRTCCTLG